MQPVPTDLILHALAENLTGMEGNDESLRSLGHTILRTCIDTRALPAQWCNGAGVGQQTSWLTRRLEGGDCTPTAIFVTASQNGTLIPTGQRVAAETRAMEVAIARRIADTGYSLLVTQDEGDKATAVTLLDAAHRVVGLPSAEDRAEDAASWESRVLALEGQLKAAVDLKDAWGREFNKANILAQEWRDIAGEFANSRNGYKPTTDAGLQVLIKDSLAKASTLVAQHEEMYAALRKEADDAKAVAGHCRAVAAAHFADLKTARDEADVLRTKLRQEEAKVLDLEADVERLAEAEKRADLYRDHMHEVRAALGILTIKSHSETINRIADIRNVDSSRPTAERLTWIARFNNGNGGVSLTLDGRTVFVGGKMADDLAEALHPRRQHVTDLKDKVATLERDHAALGNVAATAAQRVTELTRENESLRGEARSTALSFTHSHKEWLTWAHNLLGVDDGTAQELQECIAKKLASHEMRFNLNMGLHKETEAWSAWAERTSGRHNPTAPHARQVIERRIGDMAAVCDALKLDREASHEDIIETIKSLQADRAKLCALVCGDNDKTVDAPVDAPRFKIGDRVAASPRHQVIHRYGVVINAEPVSGMYRVDLDNGNEEWFAVKNLSHLPKVDP